MTVWIGTSGWQYKDWKPGYYPLRFPQRLWLEHYVEHFRTVEVNNAFYRLPKRETFEGWRNRTSDDFVVTVKASRYLTHIKRLKEPEEPVGRLMEMAAGLGSKLGPVLVQLPPNLQLDLDNLDRCLRAFPDHVRVAVEPRHATWWTDEVRSLLERHGAALSWADRFGPITPLWRTADWGYHRFHEGRGDVWPHYTRDELRLWAHRIAETYAETEDVYVYFNNDPKRAALHNAVTFADEVRTLGREHTRVPPADAITDPAPEPALVE